MKLVEVSDIVGADMTVRNGAGATVANMVRGLDVVLVGGEERAVGSDLVGRSPVGGQLKFRILIQNVRAGGPQRGTTQVPPVHEGQQMRGNRLIKMPRGLRGAEPASDGECRQDAAALSILDLGAQALRGTKVARPAAPTIRVIQRFEHAARRHPFLDGFRELLRGQRRFYSSGSWCNRLTIGPQQHGLIGADRVLHPQHFALQPLAQIADILLGRVRETSVLQKFRDGLGLRFDRKDIVRERTVVGCPLDIDIAALERLNEFEERGGFEGPERYTPGSSGTITPARHSGSRNRSSNLASR
jgi:hypothetical protein